MSLEINGIFGLLILAADIWAIVSTVNSTAATAKKVGWILLVLILPILGLVIWYFAGPRASRASS
jgi:hypothetical protein